MKQEKVQVMQNNTKGYGENFALTLQQYCYFEMAEKKCGLETTVWIKISHKGKQILSFRS
jgi:hypothetical protein